MQICMVILLGAKQYFGDPIICDSSTNSVPRDVMNNYCWIHGTSTLEEYLRPAVKNISRSFEVVKYFLSMVTANPEHGRPAGYRCAVQ